MQQFYLQFLISQSIVFLIELQHFLWKKLYKTCCKYIQNFNQINICIPT